MNNLVAVPDAIRRYGDTAADLAADTLTVGTVDQTATIAAAIPVFGLIGADFLGTFAVAQGNHFASVAELAAVHAGTALTAYHSAATYQDADDTNADSFTGIERI